MFKHNSKATLAAGSPPKLQSQIEHLIDGTGLLVGIIREPGIELLIGSCAVAIERKPADGGWLPIAPDVAIALRGCTDGEFLCQLNPGDVYGINRASFEHSRIIAGRSKPLTHISLLSGPDPKDV